ncbi:TIGR02530 family flagellar biosynthesis protein [Cytobacillus firmus]|uniref:Flagellar operon protein n=1 Tax=Cytobacillus firmus DS1 TaxID=1307436 RepID=W7L9S9_CYTFI|nr:TIGR02530 family flagellar biosynthesis protein [Cytobacillus firmus]EWG11961.1 flagellar operon protein [Cytobacillus firmus DS1]
MDKLMFRPIHTQNVVTKQAKPVHLTNKGQNGFSKHLQTALENNSKLIVSKHAEQRMNQRGIEITGERWQQIENKMHEAKKLGVNESLVLLKDAALVVSAKNNTVITAMDRQEAGTQIFTNINGTIILD